MILPPSDAVVFFPVGSFLLRFPHHGNFARQRQAPPFGSIIAAHTTKLTASSAYPRSSSFGAAEAWWDSLLAKKLQAGEAATKLGKQPRSPTVPPPAPTLSPCPSRPGWRAEHATAKRLRRQPSVLEWASFDARRSLGEMADGD